MATAVEQEYEPRTSPMMPLPLASLLGAVYIVVAVAVVVYGVPELWSRIFGGGVFINDFADAFFRQTLRVVLVVAFFLGGRRLLGATPQKGIRGGIFLILLFSLILFLVWRWLALSMSERMGQIVSTAVAGVLAFFTIRVLIGKRGERWMIGLEEQGWFHASTYKRILGQKVRRLTIMGVLLLGGSGCYSLWAHGSVPDDWKLTMPFEMEKIPLLSNAGTVVPWLLMALTAWVAYRAVNVPSFAEFLIATEAEMNKVSWTPRKRLGQDTVVVLITTLLLALFLLVVDIFWGSLLSYKYIGVLPMKATTPEKGGQVQQARW